MNKRCVNCGINNDAIHFTPLKNIPIKTVQKLANWLKPSAVLVNLANTNICEPCFRQLLSKKKRGNPNRNICIGCGVSVPEDSIVLYGDNLQVCRYWASDISINHLNKICQACNEKLYNSPKAILAEPMFVGVESHEPVDDLELLEETGVVKSEPESSDHEDGSPTKQSSDNENNDSMSDHSGEKNQNGYKNISKIRDDLNCSEESVSFSDIKLKPGYINYEFLEDIEAPDPERLDKTNSTDYKGQPEDDDDYIPPASLTNERKKNNTLITDEGSITIELKKYKRTTRIGRCVFSDCMDKCVSLIPRTVRREMVIEHDTYIPLKSKVCIEHLQDQNWEDLSLNNTTSLFRAEHCQDLKNILSEFCRTNFDFENIDTVDSKLVRYWFDMNKATFKRIINQFHNLKRLKEPNTAFAVYLMHLQNTSIERIALLLRMKDKVVKRRIVFVRDIVKCDTYKALKETFLIDE